MLTSCFQYDQMLEGVFGRVDGLAAVLLMISSSARVQIRGLVLQ